MLRLVSYRAVVGDRHCQRVVFAYQDLSAESSAIVPLSKEEIPFTFFTEERNLEKSSLCHRSSDCWITPTVLQCLSLQVCADICELLGTGLLPALLFLLQNTVEYL